MEARRREREARLAEEMKYQRVGPSTSSKIIALKRKKRQEYLEAIREAPSNAEHTMMEHKINDLDMIDMMNNMFMSKEERDLRAQVAATVDDVFKVMSIDEAEMVKAALEK